MTPSSRAPRPGRIAAARTEWVANLASDPATQSNTSVCLRFTDPELGSPQTGAQVGGRIVALLDKEGVAKDIGAYRTAPPGLRVWCGSTVETRDLEGLVPWLDWAYAGARAALT